MNRSMGLYRDHGKENGNHYSILGLHWDNGKENGNYYSILRLLEPSQASKIERPSFRRTFASLTPFPAQCSRGCSRRRFKKDCDVNYGLQRFQEL